MKYQKNIVFLTYLIFTFLPATYQVSLAAEAPVATSDTSSNLLAQPIRLQISLSRHQVTLYHDNTPIKNYPVAIGRAGWETPKGNFKVMQMLKKPTWIHPFTGEAIPGGSPDNPLGQYWIGFWTNGKNWIGFHGTPNPESVGKPASHGCIRMYNKDVEELFRQVKVGTPVTVVP
jgi:lipoprotein-anchoring transpeptidase ErfK/SrfK